MGKTEEPQLAAVPNDAAQQTGSTPPDNAPASREINSVEAWLPVLLFWAAVLFMLIIGWAFGRYRPLFMLDSVTGGHVICDAGSDLSGAFLRRGAQVRWQAWLMLATGMSVGLAALSLTSLWRSARMKRCAQMTVLGMSAIGAIAVLYRNRDGIPSELADRLGCPGVGDMIHFVKTVGEVAGILAGAAMCALLTFPAQVSESLVVTRMRELRILLYLASGMLVVGVSTSSATMHWLLSLWASNVQGDLQGLPDAKAQLASAGAMVAAAMYTLLLGAFFVPAKLGLVWHARSLAPANLEPAQLDAWLLEHGLHDDQKQILGNYVAVLAPLLSGPAAALVERLMDVIQGA